MKRLIITLLILLLGAAPATAPSDLEELKQKALSDDVNTSKAAFKSLIAKGAPAKPVLREVVRELLTRDKGKIQENAALLADAAKYNATDQKITELRKLARQIIDKLETNDGLVKTAQENYQALAQLQSEMAAPLRSAIYDCLKRRPELLAIWRQTPTPPAENPFLAPEEAKLIPIGEKALGMTVSQASTLTPATERNEPKDAAKRHFWFFRACRQIEAYNANFDHLIDKEEIACAKATNAYRESLGIMPLEIDARLIQAARRHSKEMADLKYFSHKSPNESEFDFARRYKNAGFPHLGSENIAMGLSSGDGVFRVWFNSPGHHINMARPESTSLGIGRWKNYWTQNMGSGPRLMFASDTERNRLVVRGDILKPDVEMKPEEERRTLPGLPADLFK